MCARLSLSAHIYTTEKQLLGWMVLAIIVISLEWCAIFTHLIAILDGFVDRPVKLSTMMANCCSVYGVNVIQTVDLIFVYTGIHPVADPFHNANCNNCTTR